jgi:VWFA-related protein
MAQETAIFRTGTQLVLVNVVVRDKNGPVYGLTKDSFELFDKGKPQSIAVFQPPVPPTARTQAAAAPPPNLYTNRFSPAMMPRGATVILIDMLNTEIADQQYVRKQILKLLANLDRRQRIAILLLTNKLTVLQDFTDDRERLRDAAGKVRGNPSPALSGSTMQANMGGAADEETDSILNESLNELRRFNDKIRVEGTLDALQRIAAHMSGIAGAKNLIWITSGFVQAVNVMGLTTSGPGQAPQSSGGGMSQAVPSAAQMPQSYGDEIAAAVRDINNSGIAISAIDARGLVGFADSKTAAAGGGSRASSMRSSTGTLRPPNIETLQDLSERTGGKAYYGSNDIAGAIRQVLDDADATYVLGFYPEEKSLDKKFHDLKVKVAHSADVRFRKMYFAGENAPPSDNQVEGRLRDASKSPMDAGGIGIAAQVGPGSKSGAFLLRIAFELSDLHLERKDDKWKGAAEMVIVQQGNDGRTLQLASETYTFDMKDDAYRARLREGVVVDKEITPEPGMFQVKVLVADRTTGVVGSIRVPAPKK